VPALQQFAFRPSGFEEVKAHHVHANALALATVRFADLDPSHHHLDPSHHRLAT
jgi:hypothetical protein